MQFPLGPGVCAGLAELKPRRETGKLMLAGLGWASAARSETKDSSCIPLFSSAELRKPKPLLSVLSLPAQKAEGRAWSPIKSQVE